MNYSVERTNNVLESYNRRFGDKFPNPMEFGRIVDEETNEWIDKTEYAAMNVYTNARKRKVVEWPKVHADFNDWVAPIKKNRKKKGTK